MRRGGKREGSIYKCIHVESTYRVYLRGPTCLLAAARTNAPHERRDSQKRGSEKT